MLLPDDITIAQETTRVPRRRPAPEFKITSKQTWKNNIGVSIIVCMKNNEDTIRKSLLTTLKSIMFLQKKTGSIQYELILVYAPSNDYTLKEAYKLLKNLRLLNKVTILCDMGKGLGYARHIGALKAKHPFVVYADADKAINSEWLFRSLNKIISDPLLAGLTDLPFILGKSYMAKLRNGYILAFYITATKLKHWFDIRSLPAIRSGNSIWRRPALLMVGGFSSRFKKANEDLDVSIKLRKIGYKLDLIDAISFQLDDHNLKTIINIFRNQGNELHKTSSKSTSDPHRASLFQKLYIPVMIILYPYICVQIAKNFNNPHYKTLIGIKGAILWPLFLVLHKLVVALEHVLITYIKRVSK